MSRFDIAGLMPIWILQLQVLRGTTRGIFTLERSEPEDAHIQALEMTAPAVDEDGSARVLKMVPGHRIAGGPA